MGKVKKVHFGVYDLFWQTRFWSWLKSTTISINRKESAAEQVSLYISVLSNINVDISLGRVLVFYKKGITSAKSERHS